MADRKRKILLRFYVDDNEHEIIKKKMEMTKITTLSAYLRKSAIDGYILNLDLTEFKKIGAALHKIGVNINQIAKVVNETKLVYQNDIDDINENMTEIWQLLRSKMTKLI